MKSKISAICIASSFAIVTNISAGLAADMAVKAPMAAPPTAYNWTGWYAGLNVGGGWGDSKNNFTATFPPATPAGSDTTQMNGVIGGGQLGYNWQSGTWVFGLETDIQGAGLRGSNNTACSLAGCIVPGSTIADTEKLTWFGTTRGRVGVTSGSWLALCASLAVPLMAGSAPLELPTCQVWVQLRLPSLPRKRVGQSVAASKRRSPANGHGKSNIFTWTLAQLTQALPIRSSPERPSAGQPILPTIF